jgi:hypothetical protein
MWLNVRVTITKPREGLHKMSIDSAIFQEQFEHFKKRIHRASGLPFSTFREGLPAKWEGYKAHLRERALRRLAIPDLLKIEIGEGAILERLIACIEISAEAGGGANNLVRWENRFGHANRSHHVLLDARTNMAAMRSIEAWAIVFFGDAVPAAESFAMFRQIAGSRYDLIAYLFFLKDWHSYMPIVPTTFDRAFSALGIDLVTRQQCSWYNYERYNHALMDILSALAKISGIPNLHLVDAHSFCWLLVRPELDRVNPIIVAMLKVKSAVRTFDSREKSIVEMAYHAMNTARNANGQLVVVTKKEKELILDQRSLEAHIRLLLEKQEEKCALTGIPLQYRGDHKDQQLLASLDRIDSDGHYALGNLQVVCRFINAWKSNMANAEFIRLLSLVRPDEVGI